MNLKNQEVTIFDFEDSFTYNIANVLYRLGVSSKIIHYKKLSTEIEKQKKQSVFIFGPGPGHSRDYEMTFPIIKKLVLSNNHFIYGICLGHQLVHSALGGSVIHSKYPVHGESVLFKIPQWEIFSKEDRGKILPVQRYNSLVVDINTRLNYDFDLALDVNSELMMSMFLKTYTCQFHPESVGTSCPEIFFRPVLKFLYN